MNVKVIEGCISCGLCTEEFPDLFAMNDEGIAQPVSAQVPAGKEGEARQAAEVFQNTCPEAEVVVLSGGQPVYYYIISME